MRREEGQSALELVGVLPLVVGVVFAALQVLSAGFATELANHAAEAGALALAQGRDPQEAIDKSLPAWPHGKIQQRVSHGRVVEVTVVPLKFVPLLAQELTATARSDAGANLP